MKKKKSSNLTAPSAVLKILNSWADWPKDIKETIQTVLKTLTPREEIILRMKFGIGADRTHTNKEIGRHLSMFPREVEVLEKRALRGLMHPSRLKVFAKHFNRKEAEQQETTENIELVDIIETVSELSPYLIKYLKKNQSSIDKLKWDVFEHLVAEFFASWDYDDVRLVGRDKNTSADIFAVQKIEPSGIRLRYFIEVKQSKNKIGIEIIDRVYGAMIRERPKHGWHLVMLISLVGFKDFKQINRQAISLLGVELRDRENILKWLKDYRPSDKGLWLPTPIKHIEPVSLR